MYLLGGLRINKQTFYNWHKKYGGMESQDLKRLKDLEEENRRLKQMYAELAMDNKVLKRMLYQRSSKALREKRQS